MSIYDVVAGVDNTTLNALVSDLFEDLGPETLSGSETVGESGIASVRYRVTSAPIVTLAPSDAVNDRVRDALETSGHPAVARASEVALTAMRDAAAAASFSVRMPDVELGITFDGGGAETVLRTVITAGVMLRPGSGADTLTVEVMTLKVEIPGEPVLNTLIDKVVVPRLIPVLNAEIAPIDIPPIRIPVGSGVTLGTPMPLTRPPHLLAFSSVDGRPDVPGDADWPTGAVFAGVSSVLLQKIVAAALPVTSESHFSLGIVSGGYRAAIDTVSGITVGADGSVTVRVSGSATANLSVDLPWFLPDFSFSPSASISVDARAHAEVFDGTLTVVIDDIGHPDVDFDFGIPDWVVSFLDPAGLHEKLVEGVLDLVANQLNGMRVGAVQLPSIPLVIKGKTYLITLADVAVGGMTGANDVSLLVVRGVPRFSPGRSLREKRIAAARTAAAQHTNGTSPRALVPTA